jgi:hypothetical protein
MSTNTKNWLMDVLIFVGLFGFITYRVLSTWDDTPLAIAVGIIVLISQFLYSPYLAVRIIVKLVRSPDDGGMEPKRFFISIGFLLISFYFLIFAFGGINSKLGPNETGLMRATSLAFIYLTSLLFLMACVAILNYARWSRICGMAAAVAGATFHLWTMFTNREIDTYSIVSLLLMSCVYVFLSGKKAKRILHTSTTQ